MSNSKSPKLRIGKLNIINEPEVVDSVPKSTPRNRRLFTDPKKINKIEKLEKSIRDKGLYGFIKSPRSSSTSPRNTSPQFKKTGELDCSLFPLQEEEIEFWKELLSNFQSDTPSSIIEYLIRKELDDPTRESNVLSILTYYSDINKLANFINYIVLREITARCEDLTNNNTAFSSFFSILFSLSGKYLQTEISSSIFKKCSKLKNYNLDDIEGEDSNKAMKKFKETLSEIITSIVNAKTIPNVIQFTYYTMYYLFTLKCKQYLIKTMIRYVFKIPFNSLITLLAKESPEHFQTLMTISKLFNTLIDGTTSGTYWNCWLQKNCQDLMNEMILHVHKKSWLCFDKKRILFNPENAIIIPIDYTLNEEWESLKEYTSKYSFEIIISFKDPNYIMKSTIMTLVHEIDNLRINSFNENQMYLQKMSEMKMRMKDLQEERRYLKQLLGITDDE
ncbi:hypothetical protein KM1_176870 [Entamoeba histolytica HM-3:IMSS]|uniref:Ras-GAP domain-containing protein n=5 Tax=Entamoeba histolytica TaxID=5759 RepID=C4M7S2_ENTH1|nr:hypothetical protein EHI_079310 [Entamoeba histolytica HM-1:IMSS]EMD46258.1 Hypothetical protein EHI5A_139000 [Entamoeba histolytica KU27]EMS13935.1 hypothetical protein KM1_176870 [Entamoeba histolytica HM-3:IMSS]ENY61521.1 hypothetical protein EHI7A_098240 [Entamoeba histolytica HM-1:IMSS-A]GAT97604.1 hypothetical protein CL6EHI_079310 [Entamoeba histolytica]EAL45700.2 hypothetical protein EHI_079310 [Entamoeba histolytica HM-1:IMSS]|eukprot:XP_651086.2 hypothetical protein EHI_079310 [Entamoeba histolytica HM-1:IMSS]